VVSGRANQQIGELTTRRLKPAPMLPVAGGRGGGGQFLCTDSPRSTKYGDIYDRFGTSAYPLGGDREARMSMTVLTDDPVRWVEMRGEVGVVARRVERFLTPGPCAIFQAV